MDTEWQDIEEVRKKCVDLDSELDTFFQSLKEIKEIRDFVGDLPDKLMQDQEEIESRKAEVEHLKSSVSSLLITFEEQAKGLLFDLQKKTEDLAGDVKSSMSEFKDVFESSASSLNNTQRERLEQITGAYQEIRRFFENIKGVIDSHEHSIITLNDNCAKLLMMLERTELSIKGIQNNAFLSQKKPNEFDAKMKVMEERLKEQFFTKLDRQKNIILWMLTVFIFSIIFIVFYVMYGR
jgi:chromosome segregation ATPase